MDTATDMSGRLGTQNGHVQDHASTLSGHADGQGVVLPDGEYLPLVEAAAVVQRSEKTLRRLVGKGKVPSYRESTPPYRMLVEMGAVRAALADGLGPVPVTPEVTEPPTKQPGQPVIGQSGHVQTETVREEEPRDVDLLHFLQAELERLRNELTATRTQSRAEIEAKEQRIEKLTDDLLAARRDAGKWEQAEDYRKQLYHDYMRLQSELGETKMQLKLLERNPLLTDMESVNEVYVARPLHESRAVEAVVSSPGRASLKTTLLWVLLLLVVVGGSLGVYWMTIPH